MSGAHTPGPWTMEPPNHVDIYGNPVPVDLFTPEYWFIDGPGADVHGLMTYADARLIAAAPDLLEALQDLFIDCMACDYNDGFNTSPLAKKVRAAIAKATGCAS